MSVAGNFKNGDIVAGTANAVLTGICLFVNLYEALITMLYANSGLPEHLLMSLQKGNGVADLAASLFCLAVVYLSWHINKAQAVAVMLPVIGFFNLFLSIMEIAVSVGHLSGICFTAFAVWMFYSGIAMMFHQATGKQILPYII